MAPLTEAQLRSGMAIIPVSDAVIGFFLGRRNPTSANYRVIHPLLQHYCRHIGADVQDAEATKVTLDALFAANAGLAQAIRDERVANANNILSDVAFQALAPQQAAGQDGAVVVGDGNGNAGNGNVNNGNGNNGNAGNGNAGNGNVNNGNGNNGNAGSGNGNNGNAGNQGGVVVEADAAVGSDDPLSALDRLFKVTSVPNATATTVTTEEALAYCYNQSEDTQAKLRSRIEAFGIDYVINGAEFSKTQLARVLLAKQRGELNMTAWAEVRNAAQQVYTDRGMTQHSRAVYRASNNVMHDPTILRFLQAHLEYFNSMSNRALAQHTSHSGTGSTHNKDYNAAANFMCNVIEIFLGEDEKGYIFRSELCIALFDMIPQICTASGRYNRILSVFTKLYTDPADRTMCIFLAETLNIGLVRLESHCHRWAKSFELAVQHSLNRENLSNPKGLLAINQEYGVDAVALVRTIMACGLIAHENLGKSSLTARATANPSTLLQDIYVALENNTASTAGMSSAVYAAKIAADTKSTNNFCSTTGSAPATPKKASYCDITNEYRTAGAGRIDINNFDQGIFADLYNIHYVELLATGSTVGLKSTGSGVTTTGSVRRQRETLVTAPNVGVAPPLLPTPPTKQPGSVPPKNSASPPKPSGKVGRKEEQPLQFCKHHEANVRHSPDVCTLNPAVIGYPGPERAAEILAGFKNNKPTRK